MARFAGEKGTKEQILDAAIDLFSQKGYDAVSIRDIARAVGIRESSIYNHYKGKEDILDTIMNFFMIELSKPDPDEVPMEVMLREVRSVEEFLIVAGTGLHGAPEENLASIRSGGSSPSSSTVTRRSGTSSRPP